MTATYFARAFEFFLASKNAFDNHIVVVETVSALTSRGRTSSPSTTISMAVPRIVLLLLLSAGGATKKKQQHESPPQPGAGANSVFQSQSLARHALSKGRYSKLR